MQQQQLQRFFHHCGHGVSFQPNIGTIPVAPKQQTVAVVVVRRNYSSSRSCNNDSSSSSSSSSNRDKSVSNEEKAAKENDDDDDADDDNRGDDDSNVSVYSSPYSVTILRLRAVSLFSGISGALGVPLALISKSTTTDAAATAAATAATTAPSLAFSVSAIICGFGTLGTTIALTHVFLPYVYEIWRIPIRKCSSCTNQLPPPPPPKDRFPVEGNDETSSATATTTTNDGSSSSCRRRRSTKPFLFKVVTRSLFLRRKEYVFDPTTQLLPYDHWSNPLCNLQLIQHTTGPVPLMVHLELVHDPLLRKILTKSHNSGGGGGTTTTTTTANDDNGDDDDDDDGQPHNPDEKLIIPTKEQGKESNVKP